MGAVLLACVAAPAMAAPNYLADANRLLAKGDVRAALIQLRNAVRTDPKNGRAQYELGLLDLQFGDGVAAETQARAALAAGADARLANELLARAFLAQRRYAALLREMPANQTDPAVRAVVLVGRGYAQMATQQHDAAAASFAEAAKLAPKSPDPLLGQARLALLSHDAPTAVQRLDGVLAINPKQIDALVLKAQILRGSGHAKEALVLLDRAVAAAPGAPGPLTERASTYLNLGQDAAAKTDLAQVLKVLPGNIQATYLEAVLAAKAQDWRAADADLQKVSIAMATIPRAYYLQAIVKFKLGQVQQAIEAASRYNAHNPGDPAGAKLLAQIALSQNDAAPVIAVLAPFAASGHADAQMEDMLGRAYVRAGRPDDAVEAFQRAATLAPRDAAIRTRLAATRLGLGQEGAAIGDLEQSLKLAPDQAYAGQALVFAELASGKTDAATAALARLRAAQGNTPAIGNLDGMLKLAELDLPGARTAFEAVVKQQPDFMPAQMNLAKVAAMQGDGAESARVLAGILARQPGYAPAVSATINGLLRQGNVDAATSVLQKARAAAPTNANFTAALADLDTRTGHPERALALLAPDAAHPTSNPVLLSARARAEIAMKNLSAARDTLQALVAAQPDSTEARRQLIAVLIDAKDYEAARQVVSAGLARTPQNLQLLEYYLQIDFADGGLKRSLATADRLHSQLLTFVPAAGLRGDAYMLARQPQDAATAYQAALQANPSPYLVGRLATAQAAAGQAPAAMQTVQDWTTKHPQDLVLVQTLASMQISAGDWDHAEATLKAVLAKQPHDAVALNNLAWVYQHKGDPQAETLAQQAYVLSSSSGQTADTLGWILTKQGQAAKGLPLLRQANDELPTDPSIAFHLAVALKDTGQRDAAVSLLHKLVADKAAFQEKAQAQQLLSTLSKS
ncbi:MAG TPA: XrtA/PEP-CTERM system TPR-repeat protein PrsT [Acetobacteraceae bacterium]|nr:XrtA/PEP-CTERM system TPR-repeat protein PrsT [Acetobacteraceae bacterium]